MLSDPPSAKATVFAVGKNRPAPMLLADAIEGTRAEPSEKYAAALNVAPRLKIVAADENVLLPETVCVPDSVMIPAPFSEVDPVPPLDTPKVPASVTAPVVVVEGVSPVVPALKEVTPPPPPPPLASTNAVVAICVVFVPTLAVGAVGVPVSAGEADNTVFPVPVLDVTPVPPLATVKVPVVPATIGRLVAFVRVAAEGVPRLGVVKAGLVLKTFDPDPVEVVTPVPPLDTPKVPPSVTTPEVAVDGVSPVEPALKVLTPEVLAAT
jgi:hypothetical protein